MRRRELLTAVGVLAWPGLLVLLDAGPSLRAEESERRTWRLTVEASQTENGAATFSVSDTGRGMSRSFI